MRPVEVTRAGSKILVRFPYSESDVADVKSVGGGRWDRSLKVWTFSLNMEVCTRLREVFGDRLVIGDALRDWAWEERRRRDTLEKIRDGEVDLTPTFTRLPKVAPELARRLHTRSYQEQGIAFALAGGSVLIGDQPGLGKTYQALGIVAESGARRVLVACPRTAVRSVWEAHIRELLPGAALPYVAQGTRAEREQAISEFNDAVNCRTYAEESRILIVNQEMVRVKRMYRCMISPAVRGDRTTFILDGQPEFSEPPGSRKGCQSEGHKHWTMYYPEYPELHATPWDLIIFDESHKALASTSNKSSKNITQVRLGAVRLPVSSDGRRLAVSGTPFRSKSRKAWGTLNWLRPDIFTGYWQWAGRHFEVSESKWGGKIVADKPRDIVSFKNAMRPYMIAREKAEVAPDLPPIEYAGTAHPKNPDIFGVWLDMDPAQAKAYADMRRVASAQLAGGKLTAVGVLAELTRARQFANSLLEVRGGEVYPVMPSNKADWILEFLEEREGFDGKVVIASQFTRYLHLLAEVLNKEGHYVRCLTGETSDKQRLQFVREFQDPDSSLKIGLINMFAGGESITLDAADDMIVTDDPWVDDVNRQVEDRIHRVSRIHNVTVYRLRSLGTVDERIALLTAEQRDLINKLRPEGRNLARDLLEE